MFVFNHLLTSSLAEKSFSKLHFDESEFDINLYYYKQKSSKKKHILSNVGFVMF